MKVNEFKTDDELRALRDALKRYGFTIEDVKVPDVRARLRAFLKRERE